MFNFLKQTKSHLTPEQLTICEQLKLDSSTIDDIAITENGVAMWSCFRVEPTRTDNSVWKLMWSCFRVEPTGKNFSVWKLVDEIESKRDQYYSAGLLRFNSISATLALSKKRAEAGKKGGKQSKSKK